MTLCIAIAWAWIGYFIGYDTGRTDATRELLLNPEVLTDSLIFEWDVDTIYVDPHSDGYWEKEREEREPIYIGGLLDAL